MRELFTSHPASVDETYFEHMHMAGSFAVAMLVGSLACLVHAILPFLCERTGSEIITDLHHRMVAARNVRNPETPADPSLIATR